MVELVADPARLISVTSAFACKEAPRLRSAIPRNGRQAVVCIGAELAPGAMHSATLCAHSSEQKRVLAARVDEHPALGGPDQWPSGGPDELAERDLTVSQTAVDLVDHVREPAEARVAISPKPGPEQAIDRRFGRIEVDEVKASAERRIVSDTERRRLLVGRSDNGPTTTSAKTARQRSRGAIWRAMRRASAASRPGGVVVAANALGLEPRRGVQRDRACVVGLRGRMAP